MDGNGSTDDFPNDAGSDLFKFKQKIAGQTGIMAQKMLSLKHLSNFWRTLEIPLINCEINVIPTWSAICFIVAETSDNQESTFTITDTFQLYLYPLVIMQNYCRIKNTF